jgi:hypothetical protein
MGDGKGKGMYICLVGEWDGDCGWEVDGDGFGYVM